jgi:DNA replicative helicase MCM subunit Mcm2 (Cdc46/Mcm family)
LAGDPSVGKSDILEWVNEVAPTSQSVGGENATVVGLTGGVKDGSEFKSSSWRVTSGAMAKANKGTCCVDEIDKMGEKEQKALNNVLSNQVVNITKIVNAEIKAETNALMACNPSDGRIIDKLPIDEQLPFHYTFFPRLDLIYIIRDKVQSKEEHKNGGGTQREKKGWISKYVKYARKEYDPVLTDETKDALLESFHDMRTHDNNERKIRVTRRYKDAIERLGRAHARLNLKDEVQPRDIDVALGLVEESLKRVGVMDDSVEFDIYSMETGLSEEEMEFLRFAEEYEKYGDFILDGQEEFGDSFDDLLERAKEKEELYIDEEKNLVKRKKTE